MPKTEWRDLQQHCRGQIRDVLLLHDRRGGRPVDVRERGPLPAAAAARLWRGGFPERGRNSAGDYAGQEFGEARLVELGRRNMALSAAELLGAMMKEVSGFSGGSFQDDFTLVVVAVK